MKLYRSPYASQPIQPKGKGFARKVRTTVGALALSAVMFATMIPAAKASSVNEMGTQTPIIASAGGVMSGEQGVPSGEYCGEQGVPSGEYCGEQGVPAEDYYFNPLTGRLVNIGTTVATAVATSSAVQLVKTR